MPICLGADTLCWHLRLEHGAISLGAVLDEAASVGSECVQVNLHHARRQALEDLASLADRARTLGLRLLASGDFLGRGREGDDPSVGIERIGGWLEQAVAPGSPVLCVVSGFYRAELAGWPDLVEAERATSAMSSAPRSRLRTTPGSPSCSRTMRIVDERALVQTLSEQRIAGAALDVFEQEPISPRHPLVALDNVILSPHAIGRTDQRFSEGARSAARTVLAVARGTQPPFLVNPAVLDNPRLTSATTAARPGPSEPADLTGERERFPLGCDTTTRKQSARRPLDIREVGEREQKCLRALAAVAVRLEREVELVRE
jgi:D-isomer specific 2-hydroxyacid dehydrogenase, NAD binding domain